jgi:hypothetical protein
MRQPLPALCGSVEPAQRIAVALELPQSLADGTADIEAAAVAAHIAVLRPVLVTAHLVLGIEPPGHQAGAEAQGHRCVVRKLSGIEPERPASDHVGDFREAVATAEFDDGAHGIASRQSQQRTACAIDSVCIHSCSPCIGRTIMAGLRFSRRT